MGKSKKSFQEKSRFGKGMFYFDLALCAFGGLGLEAVLAYALEPLLYGSQMNDWSAMQIICHWTATCITWGTVAFWICRTARKEADFDLFRKTVPVKKWQWLLIICGVAICLTASWIDWNGSKVLHEFMSKGLLQFIFQYIYYFCEVVLVSLIIIFGQKAAETWFNNTKIPYGGILVALTWGLAHWATKGSLFAGIYTAFGGLCFGSVYLLTNRNVKLSYALLCIMFIL